MQTEKLMVHHYSDYRAYLRDYMASQKRRNSRFGYGMWAQRMKLKSSSTIMMILKGHRNPGPELVETFIQDMKLSLKEANFFRDLVSLEKCQKSSPAQLRIMERLAALLPQKSFQIIDTKMMKVLSSWHYYAISELVDLPNFKEDPAWIQKRLRIPISLREIQEAIAVLVELDLLRRSENGQLVYTNNVHSTMDVPNEAIKRYHHHMIELAQAAIHEVKETEREISGVTFTLSEKNLARAKELMRETIQEIFQLAAEPGDQVYHIEMALFPLTKTSHKGENK